MQLFTDIGQVCFHAWIGKGACKVIYRCASVRLPLHNSKVTFAQRQGVCCSAASKMIVKESLLMLGDEQKQSASYTEADVDGDGLSYAVSAVKCKWYRCLPSFGWHWQMKMIKTFRVCLLLHTCNWESTYMYQIQYMYVMKKVQGCKRWQMTLVTLYF